MSEVYIKIGNREKTSCNNTHIALQFSSYSQTVTVWMDGIQIKSFIVASKEHTDMHVITKTMHVLSQTKLCILRKLKNSFLGIALTSVYLNLDSEISHTEKPWFKQIFAAWPSPNFHSGTYQGKSQLLASYTNYVKKSSQVKLYF